MKSVIVNQESSVRNFEGFREDILSNYELSSQDVFTGIFNIADVFATVVYGEGDEIVQFEDIVDSILTESEGNKEVVITSIMDMLQKYVNYRTSTGVKSRTIRQAFSPLRKFLSYKGIRLNDTDIKNITIQKDVTVDLHSFTLQEIRNVLRGATKDYIAFFLALVSGGMRQGETLQIEKRDMKLVNGRFVISLRGETTKTKEPREVILSHEASDYIKERYEQIAKDDLVYLPRSKATDVRKRRAAAIIQFHTLCHRAGLVDLPVAPTPHRLRSFFMKMAEKHVTSEWGNRMIGHGGYLPTYGSLTMEEKMDYYDKQEEWVTIFETSQVALKSLKQDEKIAKLEGQVAALEAEKRAKTKVAA